MKLTEVYWKNINSYKNQKIRIIANKGSTRSSKTYSILQILYHIAKYSPDALLISIVSESIPHLKRGAIRDLECILRDDSIIVDEIRNKTDFIYSIGKSQIEFFGADSDGKIHGPARDILFINECNNVRYEAYRQLAIRTRGKIFLDYNPVKKFWVDKVLSSRSDFTLIHSTYKMNNYLTKEQIAEIESNKHDVNWWNVYGLGITGGTEGLVYPEYEVIKEMPKEFKKRCGALDFGFTNDPSAIIDLGLVNGALYLDEICYKTGMTNQDIANEIKNLGYANLNFVADSAEQKSIVEIRKERLKIYPSVKGRGSIASGIARVKKYKLYVTERSSNIIDELDNYSWKKDRDGTYINEPEDKNNHCFIGDTLICTDKGLVKISSIKSGDVVLTSKGFNSVTRTFDNGIKTVSDYILEFSNKTVTLSCTSDHLINTTKGWKKISELQGMETLFLLNHSMEKNMPSIKEKNITQEGQKGCITKYGYTIMESYQKVMKFTISTLIQRTTISKISNAYQKKSIKKGILIEKAKEAEALSLSKISTESGTLQKNGMHRKKVGSGIRSMVRKFLKTLSLSKKTANNVELNMKQKNVQVQDSVQTHADHPLEGIRDMTMKKDHALIAEKNSLSISMPKEGFVKEHVLLSIKKKNERMDNVYDISVDKNHEYFANDILVHNCMDSLRYGINFLENGGSGETSINTI